MGLKQKRLRRLFKSETDLDVSDETIDQYAKWLEKLRVSSLNGELMIENMHLKNTVQKAIDVLDDGITDKCLKF